MVKSLCVGNMSSLKFMIGLRKMIYVTTHFYGRFDKNKDQLTWSISLFQSNVMQKWLNLCGLYDEEIKDSSRIPLFYFFS